MTLVAKRDHEDASYLDLAKAVVDHAIRTRSRSTCASCFVASSSMSSLRIATTTSADHGFLRTRSGWRLSPAFDVNPLLDKQEHSLALDDTSRFPDIGAVLETAKLYRLRSTQAEEIVAEVRAALIDWRKEAREAGLSGDEIDLFARAFEPS